MQLEHSVSFFGEAQSIPKQFNFVLKIATPERFISKKENKKESEKQAEETDLTSMKPTA